MGNVSENLNQKHSLLSIFQDIPIGSTSEEKREAIKPYYGSPVLIKLYDRDYYQSGIISPGEQEKFRFKRFSGISEEIPINNLESLMVHPKLSKRDKARI